MANQQSVNARSARHLNEHRQISEQLAYAGAIPFVMLTAALFIPNQFVPASESQLQQALMLYGLIVVNFVAGSVWGRAIDNPERHHRGNGQIFAIVVSLISWFAFALPAHAALLVLACLFVNLRLHEAFGMSGEDGAEWYGKARSRLTVLASAVQCLAAVN
ncbi:DUF3429 domain-containing protein [Neiella marina]|uniref:DUF3429 domain-containing protein n=1 Tax=Neiella holothuriorum TaxID=2870530 RepID=A0ABS7EHF5_9GAMM|nr:DUF3429 domain-containing protein [Neiella holothuriorum]MBW8191773.1 DUF3429 domain-containing protein [Neiella holothuriorum]